MIYSTLLAKRHHIQSNILFYILLMIFVGVMGCNERSVDGLSAPSYSTKGEVFIDDFTGDLIYAAFGGSDVKAFQVDFETTYASSKASMRYEVPDANSPKGAYAGGAYFSRTGRDLSGYNALTFYVKATQSATIDVVGFGNGFGTSTYQVALNALPVNTNWKKVIIPIPDASKLNGEKGLFYYSTGPINGKGYTFWIDEVKFEYVPDLGETNGSIYSGETKVLQTAEKGSTIPIENCQAITNLPSGVNQTITISPAYFDFQTSNSSIASISKKGIVQILDSGNVTITAILNGKKAKGSLSISASGNAVIPSSPAPTPIVPKEDVISLYSNAYTNVPIDTWNTYWQYSTTQSSFIKINNDDVIRYFNLNFVGVEFSTNQINASSMTHFHVDIWTPDETALPNNVKVKLIDFGANAVYGGGDDVAHEISITSPTLLSKQWVSLDIPLSAFTGLTTTSHLAQLVFSGSVTNLFVDNVYLYKKSTGPQSSAPNPNYPSGDVISLFSDAYTNVPGTDIAPNWGQATKVSTIKISGNTTLLYSGFNYQGLQFGSNQNVTGYAYLHLDYFTLGSTTFQVFLISPGPIETAYTLPLSNGNGWRSIDIPLSSFSPVALNNVFQLKFVGNGTIYLDNILFRK
ncbi:MAG: glycosyl hydrolase family 16 [Bacteroidota bacterium]